MNQPTFDKDGCPSDETIEHLSKWADFSSEAQCELWEFFVETFDENYGLIFKIDDGPPENCTRAHARAIAFLDHDDFDGHDIYYVATGGWSNNEVAIMALEDNHMFWGMCWLGNWRGGAYLFKIPKVEPTNESK